MSADDLFVRKVLPGSIFSRTRAQSISRVMRFNLVSQVLSDDSKRRVKIRRCLYELLLEHGALTGPQALAQSGQQINLDAVNLVFKCGEQLGRNFNQPLDVVLNVRGPLLVVQCD
ncbi:MAG: hypothetical protein ACYCPT_08120 [Acidimicrobiales bacterium]